MRKAPHNAVGGERVIGFRMDNQMSKWLEGRAKASDRTLSQVLRAIVGKAMEEGWTFGGALKVTPDAARKAGGA